MILPAPPTNTGQPPLEDLEQTKVYLDVLRRLIEERLTSIDTLSFATAGFLKATGTGFTVQASPIPAADLTIRAGSSVKGLIGKNNTTTPNTKYDLSADEVVFRDSAGRSYVAYGVSTITNDTGVSGPAANGRDQSGAFSSSSWIHFHFIRLDSDGSVATLSSTSATAPVLPSGYSSWAYAGAVRYNATPLLVKTGMAGAWMNYDLTQPALAGGTATTETSVSISTLIPPNALEWRGNMWNTGVIADGAGNTDAVHGVRHVTGQNHAVVRSRSAVQANGTHYSQGTGFTMPNAGQSFFYINSVTTGSSPSMSVDTLGYKVPNGGE